jgi:Fusaric acid resistance protein family
MGALAGRDNSGKSLGYGAVASFVDKVHRVVGTAGWLARLEGLLAQELAPSPRRLWTSLRLTTIGTIGAALVVSCHVNNELGTYIVWLLVGAGPMMPLRKASGILVAEAFLLASSVVMARVFAETPWLMLPFMFAYMALITFVAVTRELGAVAVLGQVLTLDSFYGVVFGPQEIGWAAAGAFGGSAIALGVIVLFDNWLWPDPADPILMKELETSAAHERARFVDASRFYLDSRASRPPEPPPTSDLPGHLALLDQASAEGATAHRRAVLLAAITVAARIHLEVDRLVIAARENVRRGIRAMLQPEIETAVDAIAAVLDEIAHEAPILIRVGTDQPPIPAAVRARSAMDALSSRISQVRPAYIGRAGAAELGNFGSFTDCLATLTRLIERPLDEPPSDTVSISSPRAVAEAPDTPDPGLIRHCYKVGLCTVIGYVVGLWSHRPELSVILTTIIITALPNYGATLRKMIMRIVGAIIGGLISLLMIIIVTPNFETLPAYMLALFIVLYVSAYSALSSGRVAYAGKQIGTTFVLVFTGLSPSPDVYTALWRIWGILLGTLIVAVVFLILWPAYAGDSLLPRLRKVIRDTLALVPGGSGSSTRAEIQSTNSETMRVLTQILAVADDAQLEGRSSTIDHDSVVQAAGTLRRIANRLTGIAMGSILTTLPRLDDATEAARAAVLAAIRTRLETWLEFSESGPDFNNAGLETVFASHSRNEITQRLDQFSRRLEEQSFAQISPWTLEQRRVILAELNSMRRLQVNISELDGYLSSFARQAAIARIR